MLNKIYAVASGNPSTDNQAPNSAGFRRFGRKIYAILAVIVIVIVAVAFLFPQGVAAIPLTADYQVGERMVYNTVITGTSIGSLSNMTIDSTQTVDVVDFDGEFYKLNHTTAMEILGKPFNLLEKMNKTGYSTFMLNLGDSSQAFTSTGISGDSYLTQLLNKSEVKVGDSITVPYPSAVSSVGIKGDLTVTFEGIEDITVPAGTYKVVRVSITTDNIRMEIPNVNLSGTTDMSYSFHRIWNNATNQVNNAGNSNLSTISNELHNALNHGHDPQPTYQAIKSLVKPLYYFLLDVLTQ